MITAGSVLFPTPATSSLTEAAPSLIVSPACRRGLDRHACHAIAVDSFGSTGSDRRFIETER